MLPHSARHAGPPLARRRLPLFLVAILLPSAVVIAAGARLVAQDRELAARRQVDARRAAVAGVRQRLVARLEQARIRELSGLTARQASYKDSGVALVARVERGQIILPWQDDSAALAFSIARDDPRFADALRTAERGSGNAAAGYARARQIAGDAPRRAYVDLLEASSMQGRARDARLEAIAGLPFSLRDEFGVPFALYAARALQSEGRSADVVRRVVRQASDSLLPSRALSPTTCYLLRAIASASSATIEHRCGELDAAEALARSGIPASAPLAADATPTWSYWSPAKWLVAVSDVGPSRYLVAVRSPMRILTSSSGAEPLGAEFPGAYVSAPPAQGDGEWGSTRTTFYLAALVVVLALAGTSARLLWRDVHRQIETAAMRAQFVSGVTHELKTPLTAIRMYAETMRERLTLPQKNRDEYLDIIVGESERLTRLLDNVLTFSRIERGKNHYTMRRVALNDLVQRVVRTMSHPIEQQGFTLRMNIDATRADVMGDSDALEQALLNLMTNAIKYSGDSRDIALSLAARDGEAVIEVTDHGVGIAEQDQSRIFEQFYRGAQENSAAGGAGLGLTIVRDVIVAHGGRIAVRSAPGEGSTFSTYLPVISGSGDPSCAQRAPAALRASARDDKVESAT